MVSGGVKSKKNIVQLYQESAESNSYGEGSSQVKAEGGTGGRKRHTEGARSKRKLDFLQLGYFAFSEGFSVATSRNGGKTKFLVLSALFIRGAIVVFLAMMSSATLNAIRAMRARTVMMMCVVMIVVVMLRVVTVGVAILLNQVGWVCIGAVGVVRDRQLCHIRQLLVAEGEGRRGGERGIVVGNQVLPIGTAFRSHFGIRLQEKTLNAFDVGIGAQRWEQWTDASGDQIPFLDGLDLRNLECCLYDIIAEGVLQEANQGVFVGCLREDGVCGIGLEFGQFARHHLHRGCITDFETFFNHVGAEFLRGQEIEVTQQIRRERLTNRFHTEIEHVLNNVVAKLILDQTQGIVFDFFN